jgi:hypothetical protein
VAPRFHLHGPSARLWVVCSREAQAQCRRRATRPP